RSTSPAPIPEPEAPSLTSASIATHVFGRLGTCADAGCASAAGPVALSTAASTPPAPSTVTIRFLRVFPIASPVDECRPRQTARPRRSTPRPRYRFSAPLAPIGAHTRAQTGQSRRVVTSSWPEPPPVYPLWHRVSHPASARLPPNGVWVPP